MRNPGTLVLSTPGEREITLTRTFDAPRERVFNAFTQPAWSSGGWGRVAGRW